MCNFLTQSTYHLEVSIAGKYPNARYIPKKKKKKKWTELDQGSWLETLLVQSNRQELNRTDKATCRCEGSRPLLSNLRNLGGRLGLKLFLNHTNQIYNILNQPNIINDIYIYIYISFLLYQLIFFNYMIEII